MDFNRFREIIKTYADNQNDFDCDRGKLLVEIHDELIEAELSNQNGNVFVKEDGSQEQSAESWITRRLAKLELLAKRIINETTKEKHFIAPKALLLDDLDSEPNETESPCENALTWVEEFLSRAPAGTSRLLYVISDAGEGKTTLINEIALNQAKHFLNQKSHSLVLPVSLGGRPFIRLDDFIIGTLVNKLRFRYFYYNSVIELIKQGSIILALDGFEEMFVEKTSGDAISALSNLFQLLDSQGTILVASRKAYFEYRSLETQSKLFDTLQNVSFTSARLKLEKWSETEFVSYCKKRKIAEPENLYNQLTDKMSKDNPILTRAVLAKNLIDLLKSDESEEILQNLKNAPQSSFENFIDVMIKREAQEKWIGSSGELAKPLLLPHEHKTLLSQIASEMWFSSSDIIKEDVLVLIAEIYCESLKKQNPAEFTKQVIERIRDHAMLVSVDNGKYFSFDHEEFRNYFLGIYLFSTIIQFSSEEYRRMLKPERLPNLTVDTLVEKLKKYNSLVKFINWLQQTSKFDNTASYIVENTGKILISLINDLNNETDVNINNMTYPSDSLYNRTLTNISFVNSYFHPTNLMGFQSQNCQFTKSSFERLEISSSDVLDGVSFLDCTFRCLAEIETDKAFYDPEQIIRILSEKGAHFLDEQTVESLIQIDEDDNYLLTQKALRIFMRATEVNEKVFEVKLGNKFSDFRSNVLPALIEKNIFTIVPFRGKGLQKRYKLSARMEFLNKALQQCGGNFQTFIDLISKP